MARGSLPGVPPEGSKNAERLFVAALGLRVDSAVDLQRRDASPREARHRIRHRHDRIESGVECSDTLMQRRIELAEALRVSARARVDACGFRCLMRRATSIERGFGHVFS